MRATTNSRPSARPRIAKATATALALLLASGAARAEALIELSCSTRLDVELPVRVRLAAPTAPGLLLVEELGWELQARRGEAEFEELADGPPRLALSAFDAAAEPELQLRARTGAADAMVRLRRECQVEAGLQGLPECAPPHAEDSACLALDLHAQAAAASLRGESSLALERYRRAAAAWFGYGDALRAAAARFGAAQRLATLADFEPALAALPNFEDPQRARAAAYYATRVESDRCIWLRRAGDAVSGLACARQIPARYTELGESSEAANAWFNLAAMLIEDGEGVEARASLAKARSQPEPSALVRGRIGVLQARIDYEEGRVPEALRAAEQALSVLESTPDWTWQVHALLRLAQLQLDLGALGEARQWVEQALQKLQGKQSPRVLGKARLLQARVLEAQGETAAAVLAALAARAAFVADSNHLWSLQAGLLLHRIEPRALGLEALRAEAQAYLGMPQIQRSLALAEAADALAAGRDESAATFLASVGESPSLDERHQALALAVELDLKYGRGPQTLLRIEAEVDLLLGLVQHAGSGGLRHLLALRLGGLRQVWIDTYLALPEAQRAGPETVWRVLLETHAPRQLRGLPAAGEEDPQVSRSVMAAHRFPAGEEAPGEAERARLRSLLAPLDRAGAGKPADLASTRAQMQADSVLLAWGFGRDSALLLQVQSGGARVHALGPAAAIVERLHRMDRAIRSPQTPLSALEADARVLSSLLLPARPRDRVRRLYSLMDPALPHPPLGLLTWPGETTALLATLALSRIDDAPGPMSGLAPAASAQVLYADTAASERPRLRNAGLESRLLGRTFPQLSVQRSSLSRPSQLQAALAQAGNWVHVAAHGETRRGLQGYAGLWLDTEGAPEQARFLSWLELAGHPVLSPLVVLNACALADSGDAQVGGSASFAAAISAAGADHVIAGQWAVSDGAAALWVDALYAGLAEHGDPARALQAAQQRLQASRAYRHPFYWAGLVHLQR